MHFEFPFNRAVLVSVHLRVCYFVVELNVTKSLKRQPITASNQLTELSPWPLGSAPTFQNSATHRFDGEMSRGPTGLRSCLCDGLYDTRKSVDLATLFSVNFPRNPL